MPDKKCQTCGEPIRRWSDGNLVHVTKEGEYVYQAHRPVPPPPKIKRLTHAEVMAHKDKSKLRRS